MAERGESRRWCGESERQWVRRTPGNGGGCPDDCAIPMPMSMPLPYRHQPRHQVHPSHAMQRLRATPRATLTRLPARTQQRKSGALRPMCRGRGLALQPILLRRTVNLRLAAPSPTCAGSGEGAWSNPREKPPKEKEGEQRPPKTPLLPSS
jgi:hypothetical protein